MFGYNEDEVVEPVETAQEPYVVEDAKKIIVTEERLPVCPICRFEIEAVRYTDYGDIRIVHHTSGRCTIGVMPKP